MIYLCKKNNIMKALSLKLEEDIFKEAEKITSELNIARNKYFNNAIDSLNKFYKRRLLKKKLSKESKLVAKNSMEILKEFEQLDDEFFLDENK